MTIRFAAIGLDHRHIYHMVGELIDAGAVCAGYCPRTSDPRVLDGFRTRFPDLTSRPRDDLFDDPDIQVILCAAIPVDRSAIAIRAMQAGKDVMLDKPGAIHLDQVDALERVAAQTGRLLSICFSERFVVRACEVASRLVAEGAIGRVIQTTGLGPHRLNRAIRPDWFFRPESFGGILTDIGSHQIDQFLHFTGATDARILAAATANRALTDLPAFRDYGDILLQGGGARGFIRVDWFTPDGLPTWGDGRLFLTGTEGTIELRKYVDPAGRPGADHLFLCDRHGTRHLDCSTEPLSYFPRFLADVCDRTDTAMPRGHALRVTRLAIEAQTLADGGGA
jgi:predicted dehydrogenase